MYALPVSELITWPLKCVAPVDTKDFVGFGLNSTQHSAFIRYAQRNIKQIIDRWKNEGRPYIFDKTLFDSIMMPDELHNVYENEFSCHVFTNKVRDSLWDLWSTIGNCDILSLLGGITLIQPGDVHERVSLLMEIFGVSDESGETIHSDEISIALERSLTGFTKVSGLPNSFVIDSKEILKLTEFCMYNPSSEAPDLAARSWLATSTHLKTSVGVSTQNRLSKDVWVCRMIPLIANISAFAADHAKALSLLTSIGVTRDENLDYLAPGMSFMGRYKVVSRDRSSFEMDKRISVRVLDEIYDEERNIVCLLSHPSDLPVAARAFHREGTLLHVLSNIHNQSTNFASKNPINAPHIYPSLKGINEPPASFQVSSQFRLPIVREVGKMGDVCFQVRETIDGSSLAALIDHRSNSGDPLGEIRIIKFLIALLKMLERLHNADIVHGSLSPDKIILVNDRLDSPTIVSFETASWDPKKVLTHHSSSFRSFSPANPASPLLPLIRSHLEKIGSPFISNPLNSISSINIDNKFLSQNAPQPNKPQISSKMSSPASLHHQVKQQQQTSSFFNNSTSLGGAQNSSIPVGGSPGILKATRAHLKGDLQPPNLLSYDAEDFTNSPTIPPLHHPTSDFPSSLPSPLAGRRNLTSAGDFNYKISNRPTSHPPNALNHQSVKQGASMKIANSSNNIDFDVTTYNDPSISLLTPAQLAYQSLYLAPEQLNIFHPFSSANDNLPPSKEWDLYAVGAMAYECIALQPPFSASTLWQQVLDDYISEKNPFLMNDTRLFSSSNAADKQRVALYKNKQRELHNNTILQTSKHNDNGQTINNKRIDNGNPAESKSRPNSAASHLAIPPPSHAANTTSITSKSLRLANSIDASTPPLSLPPLVRECLFGAPLWVRQACEMARMTSELAKRKGLVFKTSDDAPSIHPFLNRIKVNISIPSGSTGNKIKNSFVSDGVSSTSEVCLVNQPSCVLDAFKMLEVNKVQHTENNLQYEEDEKQTTFEPSRGVFYEKHKRTNSSSSKLNNKDGLFEEAIEEVTEDDISDYDNATENHNDVSIEDYGQNRFNNFNSGTSAQAAIEAASQPHPAFMGRSPAEVFADVSTTLYEDPLKTIGCLAYEKSFFFPPSLNDFRTSYRLAEIVAKSIHPNANERYSSCEEMRIDLEKLLLQVKSLPEALHGALLHLAKDVAEDACWDLEDLQSELQAVMYSSSPTAKREVDHFKQAIDVQQRLVTSAQNRVEMLVDYGESSQQNDKSDILNAGSVGVPYNGSPYLISSENGLRILNLSGAIQSDFASSYIAKFATDMEVDEVLISGGSIPLHALRATDSERIELNDRLLVAHDALVLSKLLDRAYWVSRLNLSNNHLAKPSLAETARYNLNGLQSLTRTISNLAHLTHLDMSSNDLGAEGGFILCKALSKCLKLKRLNLNSTNLGAKGGKEMALSLLKLSNLEDLALNSAKLGAEGVSAIAKQLSSANSLLRVSLYDNQAGDAGSASILETLKYNFRILSLSFAMNGSPEAVEKAILAAVSFNAQYKALHDRNDQFGSGVSANLLFDELSAWASTDRYVSQRLKLKLSNPQSDLERAVSKLRQEKNNLQKRRAELLVLRQSIDLNSGSALNHPLNSNTKSVINNRGNNTFIVGNKNLQTGDDSDSDF